MRFKSWVWMTNLRAHPESPGRIAAKNSTFDPNETSKTIHFVDGPDRKVASELHEASKDDAIIIDGSRYVVSRHWDFKAKVHYTDGTSKTTDIMAIRVGALKAGGRGVETGKVAFRLHDLEIRNIFNGPDGKEYSMESIEEIEITKYTGTFPMRNVGALRSQLSLEFSHEGPQGWTWNSLPDDVRALLEQGALERKNPPPEETAPSASAGEDVDLSGVLISNRLQQSEDKNTAQSSGEGADESVPDTQPPAQENSALTSDLPNPRQGRSLQEKAGAAPICFTKGTLILTNQGEIPVERLKTGDLVVTKDHGLQPIRWIGHREIDGGELTVHPNFLPIRIAANALGQGVPARDLYVSPQHRICIHSRYAQMLTGSEEVLVPAKKLIALPSVQLADGVSNVSYHHILLDRHELICSNGALAESFYLSEYSMKLLYEGGMAALPGHAVKPRHFASAMLPARPFVAKNHEVRRLILEFQAQKGADRVH